MRSDSLPDFVTVGGKLPKGMKNGVGLLSEAGLWWCAPLSCFPFAAAREVQIRRAAQNRAEMVASISNSVSEIQHLLQLTGIQ